MKLTRSFFKCPTVNIARELIGKYLIRVLPDNTTLIGRITETEAYLGKEDLASHASRKNSSRAQIMYGPPGHAYIYLIYGMYYCFNITTEKEGTAGAVLIRAVEPVCGIDIIAANRDHISDRSQLSNGPGKLCVAFDIDKKLHGLDLCKEQKHLYLEDRAYKPEKVVSGPRIGVPYAGVWAQKHFRFWEST